jgi:N-acyl-D-aspartate/D-glutamate deacylase|tara:strand:+ start:435 stop:2195 length:1761 start_codon:yes stop_codon:yes gene_type:complete
MFDLIVRNGRIVDGTGVEPFYGDVAVTDGRIVEVGSSLGQNAKEIQNADGRLVTPGFVDVHTHYDGQVTWDTELRPSVAHGVTSIVMGNCGVGFAPVRPGQEEWLIQLMEGVEDIPGSALSEGIEWSWETFPEYLDAVGRRQYTMNVAALVPHGALRAYVMGDRGADDEPATEEELATMARLVGEAVAAGAAGFSTSRIQGHQAKDGRAVPGTTASEDELRAIIGAMGQVGRGVLEAVPSGILGYSPAFPPDRITPLEDLEMLRRLALESGRPITFGMGQTHAEPELYKELLAFQDKACAEGARLHGQIANRPGGVISSFQSYHPFSRRPTYLKIADLRFTDRIAELRKSEVRAAILAEGDVPTGSATVMDNTHSLLQALLPVMFPLGSVVDYEPEASQSVVAQAQARGEEPLARLYDLMLEKEGKATVVALAANYAEGDHAAIELMLQNKNIVPGLSDGGAHVRLICDGSMPTYMLTHWARDRSRGPRLSLEHAVRMQTRDTAALYGFQDRGTIEVGKRADLNVIDFDALSLPAPQMLHDLPGGGARFVQDAVGYVATFVNGVATRRDDQDTGARPGRLIRDAQA